MAKIVWFLCLVIVWAAIMCTVYKYVTSGKVRGFTATYIPLKRITLKRLFVVENTALVLVGACIAQILTTFYSHMSAIWLAVIVGVIWLGLVKLTSWWSNKVRVMLSRDSIRNSYDSLLTAKQLKEQEALIDQYEPVGEDIYAVKYMVTPPMDGASLKDVLFILFMSGFAKQKDRAFQQLFPPMPDKVCVVILHEWAKQNGAQLKIIKSGKHFLASMECEGESYVFSWIRLPRIYKTTDIESTLKAATRLRIDKSVTHFYAPNRWVSIDSLGKEKE